MFKLAILASGSGSTAEAVLRATQTGSLNNVQIVCIITNNVNAGVISRFINLGFNSENIFVLPKKFFSGSAAYGNALLDITNKYSVDLIAQYGWLVKTPENFIDQYINRIINQHPGPLDPRSHNDFGGKGMYGINVHKAVIEFAKNIKRPFYTEATCHYVTAEYDQGAVIDREQLLVDLDFSVTDLAQALLPIEHDLQIRSLTKLVAARLNKVEVRARETELIKDSEISILNEVKKQIILA